MFDTVTKPKGSSQSVIDIINAKGFTLSAEIIPPRNGMETDTLLDQITTLQKVPVDFISVTKGAGGSLRGGTLPIAQVIQSQFNICSIAHFTCRDYTVEEIENSLMDHHYFGVKNILALRGDPPDGIPDYFKPAPNRHMFAYQLSEQIKKLNNGEYLVRQGFDQAGTSRPGKKVNFCIGVAAYPDHVPFEQGLENLEKKVNSGAQFAITQMIFSADTYGRFLDACQKRGINIPILPGLRIITQASTAEFMTKRFGVPIPKDLMEKYRNITSPEDGKKIGLEAITDLCHKLKRVGAPGIHVFVMNDATTAAELLVRFQ